MCHLSLMNFSNLYKLEIKYQIPNTYADAIIKVEKQQKANITHTNLKKNTYTKWIG